MKRWMSLIPIVIILGLLAWVLKDIDFEDVYLLLSQINLSYFGLAVLSMLSAFLVWNFRLKYFLNPYIRADFLFLSRVLFAGVFFNTVTPGAGIGGEPFKSHYIAKKYKRSRIEVFGYVFGDKFFQLVVQGFFIILAILFVLLYIDISKNLALILEIVLFVVLCFFGFGLFFTIKKFNFNLGKIVRNIYFLEFVKKRFASKFHLESYINKRISTFSKRFLKVVRNKKNLFLGIFLSLIYWLLIYFVPFFLFLSFGYKVNFISVIIVVVLGELIGSLSMSPGGVGVAESSMVLLYSAIGVPVYLALVVAFLSRIIYYFYGLVVGGLSFIYLRKNLNGNGFL